MRPRIIVDVMGADRPPGELAAGALRAAERLPITLLLAGLRRELPPLPPEVEVLEPTEGRSSIEVGIAALAAGQAEAFLSPGSTGAVVRAAVLGLGRLPGLLRPGLCASLPSLSGEALLIDAGATADPKPAYLLQYADLGVAYAREVLGIPSPAVGLLNIGEEPGKGDRVARAAHDLLAARKDFVGNVEPHEILTERPVDVVVTGGFSGNLLLKALEGGAEAVLAATRSALRGSLRARLGALLARPALREVARRLRYEEHNAAPLLGVRGLVLVAHGRSDARAMEGALRRTHRACQAKVLPKLAASLAP
ncbi:MAG: phosphate--acyl-ACP acyltransferase [Candidatus Bipolaricaulota bacterium]|nr:phosphate--acyl-ACP acyltransferase [Candidatus Bipolaricaulota bacterium]